MNVMDQRYGIDEQIIEDLAWSLANADYEEARNVLSLLEGRLDGKCFCHAYSSSECLCGAWDGEYD